MKQSLPGIIHIGYADCQLLPKDITLKALANVPVGIYTTITDITLRGEAVCELETQFDNNTQVEKASLTFYSLDEVPAERHLAFVIFTANKVQYIIGSKELPPTVKASDTTGTPNGDPAVKKYEVTYSARKALIRCSA